MRKCDFANEFVDCGDPKFMIRTMTWRRCIERRSGHAPDAALSKAKKIPLSGFARETCADRECVVGGRTKRIAQLATGFNHAKMTAKPINQGPLRYRTARTAVVARPRTNSLDSPFEVSPPHRLPPPFTIHPMQSLPLHPPPLPFPFSSD